MHAQRANATIATATVMATDAKASKRVGSMGNGDGAKSKRVGSVGNGNGVSDSNGARFSDGDFP